MSDIFFTGITDAISMDALDLSDRLERREIIQAWAKYKNLSMQFENTYLGIADNMKYRFQVQEYKDVEKEYHQFRIVNLNDTDYIVVIVQDSADGNKFHSIQVEINDENRNKIDGKTISYRGFLELAKKEEGDEFDI